MKPDLRTVIMGRRVIELLASAALDERVVVFTEAKRRFSPGPIRLLDDWPPQPACRNLLTIWGKILVFKMGKSAVLLKQ